MIRFPALYWSVRRELWEHRLLFAGPVTAAAIFFIGFLVSASGLPSKVQSLSTLEPMHQRDAIAAPYDMASGLLMFAAMLVGGFYCVNAISGERRDRSILFWKALPVSDLTAILAKACIPLVFLPLFAFAVTFTLHLAMLVVSSAILWANHLNPTLLWTQLSFFRMSLLLLYHLITIHSLWHAPLYGWLLFVSAWARRGALLWAVLPPIAIGAAERLVFHTNYLIEFLGYRLSGGGMEAITLADAYPMDPTTHPTVGLYLVSSGLWIGLAITAAFLAASARLRHVREPL